MKLCLFCLFLDKMSLLYIHIDVRLLFLAFCHASNIRMRCSKGISGLSFVYSQLSPCHIFAAELYVGHMGCIPHPFSS